MRNRSVGLCVVVVACAGATCTPRQAAADPTIVTPFFDHDTFVTFNQNHGKVLKGIETFEEGVIAPGGKTPFPEPLCFGVPRPPVFPNGIIQDNLWIQTNITPGPNPPLPNPSNNAQALYAVGPGFNLNNSIVVGEDLFLQNVNASLDLIFVPAEHTGIGFDLSRFQGFPNGGWQVGVFDAANNLLGSFAVPAPAIGAAQFQTFFGVWSPIPIGRINLFDMAGIAPDGVDNIEMWVPAPGSLAVLGLAPLMLSRRRR